MKSRFGLLLFVLLISSCSKNQQASEADAESDNPNQVLYDQVMDVHDEVMPRMDDIMKLKRQLQEQIASTPDMVVERKQQLEKMISNLDSASSAMMNWMHEFNPIADSVDQELAREYLESEMEKIRNVKTLMLETIDKAKQESNKQ